MMDADRAEHTCPPGRVAARQFENPGESADVFPTKDALENASITPGFEAYSEANAASYDFLRFSSVA